MFRLISKLDTNNDGSHNKLLHKSFFNDVRSMIKNAKRIETDTWKEKWSTLTSTCSINKAFNDALNHKIMPHVAGHGIKKLLDRDPTKCHVHLNKISCGQGTR